MALFSITLENPQQLFVRELRDLYDAETQITHALPKMIVTAHNSALQDALREHLQVTKNQISRLDRIFDMLNEKASDMLNEKASGETCKGMKGLLKEGDEIASADGDPSTIDAGIITAAQRVEHYKMAGYGAVRTYAELLGQPEMARLLQETLDEEKGADETLSDIANTVTSSPRQRSLGFQSRK